MPPFLRGDSASMKFLRVLTWLLRAFLFLMLFLFALKNAEAVRIHFIFDVFWDAPLSFLLLITLIIGASLGMIAVVPRIFAQRREIASLKKQIAKREAMQILGQHSDGAG